MRGRGRPMFQRDEVLAPTRDQTGRAFREARRTGALIMPARGLTEFPKQAYHLEDHLDKDEKKWECVDLVKIDMSHNSIPSIGDDISCLQTLTSIKMCQNQLAALPEGLYRLTSLIFLDLSNNQLKDLSEGIGQLYNLRELSLAANRIAALPDSISKLANLESFSVQDNALLVLPSEFGCLKKLHTLCAHTNQLSTLPPSFRCLSALQTLDLKKNRIDSVTDQLSSLMSLKFLDVRQNKLTNFPQLPQSAVLDQVFLGYNSLANIDEESILRAKDSITVLDLRDNKLDKLPANIACLYRLKTLDLSNNDLVDLPPGLGYLKYLNHFIIDGNPLRAIRRSILSAGCESLKKYLRTRGGPPSGVDVLEEEIDELQLQRERQQATKDAVMRQEIGDSVDFAVSSPHVYRDASSSGLLDLTGQVLRAITFQLKTGISCHKFASTLIHLVLSKNHLTQLPKEIGELSALASLTVEDNHLTEIHPDIAMLPKLALLRLRKNQLTCDSIESFLGTCELPALSGSLKELDIRNNLVAKVPPSISKLSALETLLLSFNKIESLHGFPWEDLRNVSVISISDNRLKSLGNIYHVSKLASLSVENNNLSQIPCELGLCPHLRAIYINGNPQKTVRGTIIAKGSLEILMYLKNKLPADAVLSPPPPHPHQSAAMAEPKTVTSTHAPALKPKYSGMYAASADASENGECEEYGAAPVVPLAAKALMAKAPNAILPETSLSQIDNQIADLESQLECHGLSAPKRYALKKELALLRSTRIRETRRLADQ